MVKLITMLAFVVVILVCLLFFNKSNKNQRTQELQDNGRESNIFGYVISFLIPLVGYILGAILLSKDNTFDKSVGKNCIILGIISSIIGGIATAIFLSSIF